MQLNAHALTRHRSQRFSWMPRGRKAAIGGPGLLAIVGAGIWSMVKLRHSGGKSKKAQRKHKAKAEAK